MKSSRDWERWYKTLRAVEPDAYRKAIEFSEGVSLTHNLDTKVAADVEVACVMLACDLLGVKP